MPVLVEFAAPPIECFSGTPELGALFSTRCVMASGSYLSSLPRTSG